ncbi:MAG: hypothetical protein ACQEXM_26130 [Actinomycetota bacterium]|uniref:hypothetical protein n=1 Tax=Pseudonocardia sp. UM4_GMWB1 TaxID=2212989 RepID=UPI00307D3911
MLQIKLGPQGPAFVGDALGRSRVGAFEGMSPQEAWLAGRGAWKLNPSAALAQDEAQVIDSSGTVLAVARITGISKAADGRFIVDGELLVDDARVGQPTPHPHRSRNPLAYF